MLTQGLYLNFLVVLLNMTPQCVAVCFCFDLCFQYQTSTHLSNDLNAGAGVNHQND